MELFVLIEEMKRLRNAAIYDIRQLEGIIERTNQRHSFLFQQARNSKEFIELADLTSVNIRQLEEAIHTSRKALKKIERAIVKLELLLPLAPPPPL